MAYTTIDDPSAFFQCKTYTGNGGTQAITFDGNSDMQPDYVWVKSRSLTKNHKTSDSVRGVTKAVQPNDIDGEATDATGITAFGSNGFTLGNSGDYNTNNATQVSWNWKESATAGFDIVSFTGNASARTISHSLSAVPHMVLIKRLDQNSNWCVYHKGLNGADHNVFQNNTSAIQTDTAIWNNTHPTNSVFSLGNNADANGDGAEHICFLFAPIKGYSKFGSYTGNGNVDGTFIYTGFKPAYFYTKRFDSGNSGLIFDNKRLGYNEINNSLYANVSDAEETGTSNNDVDFLSNGIKIREDNNALNASGGTYIYSAYAEQPLVTSTGIPATAR